MKKQCTPIAAIGFVLLLGGCSGPDAPPVSKRPDDKSSDQKDVVRGLRCTLTAEVRPDKTVGLTFQLHNETGEPIRFVFARGRHHPWGSARPVVTDPNGQRATSTWLIPAYVGAGRTVLSVVVIPPRGTWKLTNLLPTYDVSSFSTWIPGTYTARVRFRAWPPTRWLGLKPPPPELGFPANQSGPDNLDALRGMEDVSFWAGEILSEPIRFTFRGSGAT